MLMLSRVANNLYWMGRYIERAEHLARYAKEIYFSSLDAPIVEAYDRKFVLESMLYMAGIFDMEDINERDVLFKIGMDTDNASSIKSIITSARENARGARNNISTDLWEEVNKYYHFIQNYSEDYFLSSGLYNLTQYVLDQTSILRGKIYGTLLHDQVWAVINLGMHFERAIQVIRIVNSKLHDVWKIESAGYSVNELSFEWTTLLRCTESFDMNRKYYGTIPNRNQVLEFLMLNIQCPRSVKHSLQALNRFVQILNESQAYDPESVNFKIGKLCAKYNFLTIDDYKNDIYGLLNDTKSDILEISAEFERKYLSF